MLPCHHCREFVEPEYDYQELFVESEVEPVEYIFLGRKCPNCGLLISTKKGDE